MPVDSGGSLSKAASGLFLQWRHVWTGRNVNAVGGSSRQWQVVQSHLQPFPPWSFLKHMALAVSRSVAFELVLEFARMSALTPCIRDCLSSWCHY